MRFSLKPILLCFSSFVFALQIAQPAHAEDQVPFAVAAAGPDRAIILQARALAALGDRESACEVVADYRGQRSVGGNFLAGMCARQSGELDNAIDYFRAVLAQDPDLTRARLELARTLYRTKRFKESRRQFELALETGPPANVEANIRRFLSALEGKKNWNIRISAGALYDDNVNSGPASGEILLFDTPFTLNDSSLEQDTAGFLFSLSGDYTLVLSDQMAWRVAGGGSKLFYLDHGEFEIGVVSASTGPVWRGKKFIAGIDGIYQRVWLGNDTYSENYGVRPSLNFALGRHTTLVTTAGFEKRTFDTRPGRDGERYYGGASLRFSVNGKAVIQPGYRYSKVKAADDTEGYDRHEISLNGVSPIGERWTARAGGTFWLSDYDAPDPAFGTARSDKLWRGHLALMYEITSLRMSLVFNYSYTNNDSNITLFDYDRHQASLTVTKRY